MFIKICNQTINTDHIVHIDVVTVYPRHKFRYGGERPLSEQQKADRSYTETRVRVHLITGQGHLDLDIPEHEFYKYFKWAEAMSPFFADLDAERDKDSAYRPPADVGSESA